MSKHRLKANLHIHTYHSDGIYTPSFIVGYAKLLGIEVISITDHNEIRGAITASKVAKKLGLIFFPGIELTFTIKGLPYEILAYFYDVEDAQKFYSEYRFGNGFLPAFKNVSEVLDLIKKHNGTEVVPHPFGRKGILRKSRNKGLDIGAIEVINAFTGEKRNGQAKNHKNGADHFLKLGASDMHFFVSDIHKVYTELSSNQSITKEAIWQNLKGQSSSIDFVPKGYQFSDLKIWFQKPLCTVVYAINYPRLYLSYRLQKIKHAKYS